MDTDKTEDMVSGKDSREVTIVDSGNVKLMQVDKLKYLDAPPGEGGGGLEKAVKARMNTQHGISKNK